MHRRSFIRTVAALPATSAVLAGPAPPPNLTTKITRLNLQHTWTTTMSSSQYRDTLHVAYQRDGITGHGEGAPIVRYHEDAEGARKAVESVRDCCSRRNPCNSPSDGRGLPADSRRMGGEIRHRYRADGLGGPEARHAALRYFGLDPKDAPVTTFSIGIDTPEITGRRPGKRRHIRSSK